MIIKLVKRKNIVDRIGLYILNQLLVLDFMVASLLGFDPRLSVSTIIGILERKKGWFRWLPEWFLIHCKESAYWWNYDWPVVDRTIWTRRSKDA